jgi:hypothetical protein
MAGRGRGKCNRAIEQLDHQYRVVWDRTRKLAEARAEDQARMPVEVRGEESNKGREGGTSKSTNLLVSDT